MKKNKNNLTRKFSIRFEPEEYNKLFIAFKSTTKRRLSEYVRDVVLRQPVTVYTRDKSLDDVLTELVRLRNGLAAVGNNFNQVVKKINFLTAGNSSLISLLIAAEKDREKLIEITGEINQKIGTLSDQWLQE